MSDRYDGNARPFYTPAKADFNNEMERADIGQTAEDPWSEAKKIADLGMETNESIDNYNLNTIRNLLVATQRAAVWHETMIVRANGLNKALRVRLREAAEHALNEVRETGPRGQDYLSDKDSFIAEQSGYRFPEERKSDHG